MTSHLFRSIIAKFSIGHRGLGEIRNGRWLRSELQQVCTGFDDCRHLPPEQQYHLGAFLDRSQWQYLHGWIAVLARCKEIDAVWHEWELWKLHPARLHPKNLQSMHKLITTKIRGDYWFVEQMTASGGIKEAWAIVADSGIVFSTLSGRIKRKMLEGIEYCTILDPTSDHPIAHPSIRHELLRKYDADLLRIESALGVRWVPSGDPDDDAQGYHALFKDQEEVLEELSKEDWKLETDYGYPLASPMAKLEDVKLHDAAETTPADGASEAPMTTS